MGIIDTLSVNLMYAVSVSIACSLLNLIIVRTRFSGVVKYITGIVLIFVVVTSLSPLFNAIFKITDINYDIPPIVEDSNTEENIVHESAVYICKYTATLISQRFGIPDDQILVSVTLNKDDLSSIIIKNMLVTLPSKYSNKFLNVSDYISETLGCPVTIIPENS